MFNAELSDRRIRFFEQLHQEFLFLTGYGTYAYINSYDADKLYEAYLEKQALSNADFGIDKQINFIRDFIKSR